MDQPRVSNLNPSSLLWAHQIRREHIHIVNQFDILKTDLNVATETMNDLKRDIETLSRQVEDIKQCNAHTEGNLLHLEDRLNERVHTMLERINDLEKENGLLKTRLDILERERQPECQREREITSPVSQKKQPHVKSPARQTTVLKIACENGVFKHARSHGTTGSKSSLPGSEILAPDSMPVNQSSPLPLLRPEDYVRSLSETTWTSSCVSGNAGARDNRLRTMQANSRVGATGRDTLTREKQSSLAVLWAVCDRSPRYFDDVDEVVRVKDFVQAISDTKTRVLLEERCRDARCRSWDGLRALVHEIIGEGQNAGVDGCVMQTGSDGRQEISKNGNPVKPMLKRKRYIPIVPPDPDEQLVIKAYGQGWLLSPGS